MPIDINRMIFLRTAWMKFYQGRDNDIPCGDDGHLKENPDKALGEEVNFLPFGNCVYGYAALEPHYTININRLRADIESEAEEIKGVTVIFFSHHPEEKAAYIVGWYEEATVFRYLQKHRVDNIDYEYFCMTKKKNAYLVPPENRTMTIPHASTNEYGYGRSKIFFADRDSGKLKGDVIEYIEQIKNSSDIDINPISVRYTNDIEIKRQIENQAIEKVFEYYKNRGYVVESVESENKGWDLEARKGKKILQIEVKGKRGYEITAMITPNEYDKLREYCDTYKLCIVTNALQEDSILTIFDIEKSGDKFYGVDINNRENILEFQERVSAICRLQ